MGKFTSEAQLRKDLTSDMVGLQRQAAALLTIPAEYRMDARRELTFRMNTEPGWRPSDLMSQICRRIGNAVAAGVAPDLHVNHYTPPGPRLPRLGS